MIKSTNLQTIKVNCISDIFLRSIGIQQRQFLPLNLRNLSVTNYSVDALLRIIEICPNLRFLLFREPDEIIMNANILRLLFKF